MGADVKDYSRCACHPEEAKADGGRNEKLVGMLRAESVKPVLVFRLRFYWFFFVVFSHYTRFTFLYLSLLLGKASISASTLMKEGTLRAFVLITFRPTPEENKKLCPSPTCSCMVCRALQSSLQTVVPLRCVMLEGLGRGEKMG